MAEPFEIAILDKRLADRMEALVEALGLEGERRGREFVAYNPALEDATLPQVADLAAAMTRLARY